MSKGLGGLCVVQRPILTHVSVEYWPPQYGETIYSIRKIFFVTESYVNLTNIIFNQKSHA